MENNEYVCPECGKKGDPRTKDFDEKVLLLICRNCGCEMGRRLKIR